MRQQAWDEVKTVLTDYPKYEWYINQVRESVLYPWKPSDANADISSGSFSPDGVVNKVIKIEDNIILNRLMFQKNVVEKKLAETPEWLVELIDIMYFGNNHLKLRPASELVGVSYRTAKKYHEEFMIDLAGMLGIIRF